MWGTLRRPQFVGRNSDSFQTRRGTLWILHSQWRNATALELNRPIAPGNPFSLYRWTESFDQCVLSSLGARVVTTQRIQPGEASPVTRSVQLLRGRFLCHMNRMTCVDIKPSKISWSPRLFALWSSGVELWLRSDSCTMHV